MLLRNFSYLKHIEIYGKAACNVNTGSISVVDIMSIVCMWQDYDSVETPAIHFE